MSARRLLSSAAIALTLTAGCAEEQRVSGPPRCEPPGELVMERGLKTGFRALAEDNAAAARDAFQEVLTMEPGHPEARAGLRAAENASRSRSVAVRQSGFVAGGHDLPTSQPIDHDTLRLEVRAAEVRAAERLKLPSPRSRRALSPRSKEEQGDLSHIDLVVLHATESLTAMDRFVTLANGGQSAHFLIDWDGTVYQTLDLTMLAAHTGDDALDKRSVAIELVTPLSQDMPPLPSHAQGVERPMSQRLRIQGQLVRAWGYTAPQMASLSSLLVDLVRTLPHLKGTLTGGASVPTSALSVKEREDVRGVIGALHIDPTTIAPGPGFEWPLIRRALERLR